MRTEVALGLLVIASCKGTDAPRALGNETGAITITEKAAPTSPPLASKSFFRVDAVPEQPACRANEPCEARVVLTALGDYHVNDNYPFKLIADVSPDVKVDGTGSFSPDGKRGTLALPFRASKSGTAKIAGTFRLSVCNDDNCQIEAAKIAFDVAVR